MKLTNIWRLLFLRGVLFLAFGFLAISRPAMALLTLAYFFSLFIFLAGLSNLAGGIFDAGHIHRYRFVMILAGVIEIAAGAYAFNNPTLSLAALVLLVGLTLIVHGISEIFSSFDSMYDNVHQALLVTGGALGIIAGALVLRHPLTGSLTFTWLLGLYALVAGAILVATAVSLLTRGENA